MKIYINRSVIKGPWGGGNLFVKAFYENIEQFNFQIENDIAKADIIFIAGLDSENNHPSAELLLKCSDKKIIFRVNDCDKRKSTFGVDNRILKIINSPNVQTVFVSNWLKKEFNVDKSKVIYNGCDHNIFKPNQKFNNGKTNIVTHHWSSNRMKGFDIYEKIDQWIKENHEFTFTYIGRENGTFQNTKVIPPIFGEELGNELGKYDVYISASRNDPGPNHIVESIVCELPTYVHSSGGGCVEFAERYPEHSHVFNDWNNLENILKKKDFRPNFSSNNLLPFHEWKHCIEQYASFIHEI